MKKNANNGEKMAEIEATNTYTAFTDLQLFACDS